ncbi:hypothetical protein [Nocardioides sambongensis]|uniref:hypothetical protein n=1 Tax=Nocardioides sambongensis TaxID=2589074 RepID=UPI001129C19E|nr:hypothetical protein [Nocardioides sambongensis]
MPARLVDRVTDLLGTHYAPAVAEAFATGAARYNRPLRAREMKATPREGEGPAPPAAGETRSVLERLLRR